MTGPLKNARNGDWENSSQWRNSARNLSRQNGLRQTTMGLSFLPLFLLLPFRRAFSSACVGAATVSDGLRERQRHALGEFLCSPIGQFLPKPTTLPWRSLGWVGWVGDGLAWIAMRSCNHCILPIPPCSYRRICLPPTVLMSRCGRNYKVRSAQMKAPSQQHRGPD